MTSDNLAKWLAVALLAASAASAEAQQMASACAAQTPQSPGLPIPQGQVVRYSAGQSIILGPAPAPPQAGGQRYAAGDALPLEYCVDVRPAPGLADAATAQEKPAGYSAASAIPLAGASGDSITTYIGVHHVGLSEANGLVNTSAAGLLGLFAFKAGMVYYFEQQRPPVREAGLKVTAGLWSGLTMSNLLLIAGSVNPVGIVGGVLFGAYMYHREGQILEKQAAARAGGVLQAQARQHAGFHRLNPPGETAAMTLQRTIVED